MRRQAPVMFSPDMARGIFMAGLVLPRRPHDLAGDALPSTQVRVCLGCFQPTANPVRGRCPECRREQDAASFYQSPKWRALAAAVRRRQGGACLICPSGYRLTAHHVVPRGSGGPDTLDNLVALCGHCHSQYEGDKRAGRATDLTRLIEALTSQGEP